MSMLAPKEPNTQTEEATKNLFFGISEVRQVGSEGNRVEITV